MKSAKILVLGANGQLGKSLQTRLPNQASQNNWKFYTSSEIDITKTDEIDRLFKSDPSPQYIVNCAAYTQVDKAEKEVDKARNVNALALDYLSEKCSIYGSTLIHISTDFVFDGKISRPLKETDTPRPINVYGQTKREGEQRIDHHLQNYFILRTGWLYSRFNKNFLQTILHLAQNNETIKIVADQIGT